MQERFHTYRVTLNVTREKIISNLEFHLFIKVEYVNLTMNLLSILTFFNPITNNDQLCFKQ